MLLHTHVTEQDAGWKLTNFFGWFSGRFDPCVHAHHDNEERLMFPVIAKRMDVPPKTAADHRTLMRALDGLSALRREWFAAVDKESGEVRNAPELVKSVLGRAREQWHELRELMLPHLEEEERLMAGPIKDVFTEAEIEAIVQRIVRSEPLYLARLLVPAIFDMAQRWGSPETVAELAAAVPGPLLWVAKKYWFPEYTTFHRGAIDSLRRGSSHVVVRDPAFAQALRRAGEEPVFAPSSSSSSCVMM